MTLAPPLTHGSFTLERVYPHPPERVFFAHADTAALRRWRVESEGFEVFEHTHDFREGGGEVSRFRFGQGPEIRCEVRYHAIIPDRRIVTSYWMSMGGKLFSVSLLTIDMEPAAGGTRLTLTEQGAYIGEPGQLEGREEGTRGLLEALAAELDRSS
jgi:uncharacterized protein YndB with AHSA1/START domain